MFLSDEQNIVAVLHMTPVLKQLSSLNCPLVLVCYPCYTRTMPSPYRLNQKGVPAESFAWLEAFETWTQRTETHVNWTAVQEAGQWLAVAKCESTPRNPSLE